MNSSYLRYELGLDHAAAVEQARAWWEEAKASNRLGRFRRCPDLEESVFGLLVPLILHSQAYLASPNRQAIYGLTFTIQGDICSNDSWDEDGWLRGGLETDRLLSLMMRIENLNPGASGLHEAAFTLCDPKRDGWAFEAVREVVRPSALGRNSIASGHGSLGFVVNSTPASGRTLPEIGEFVGRQIGLASVKRDLAEIGAQTRTESLRREAGLVNRPTNRHMVFTGNPGTGKTTMARQYADILSASGALPDAHFIEADRSQFVGEFLGSSTLKTRKMIDEALGGVLFIDEAYSLIGQDDQPDQFGMEALSALLKAMEDERDRLVIIMAGYPAEMDRLIACNPGLASRIGRTLHFPDYSDDELVAITSLMADDSDFVIEESGIEELRRIMAGVERKRGFGNARFARTLLERAIGQLALRLKDVPDPSRENLVTLTADDLRRAWVAMSHDEAVRAPVGFDAKRLRAAS